MLVKKWIALSVFLFAASAADASKPVNRTLTGCVIDGAFYSVSGRAYRIDVADVELTSLEGKGVSMRGWLSPGDQFSLETDARPEVTRMICPPAALRMIRQEQAVKLRVKALEAAEAGKFEQASMLIGRAIAFFTPPDCDTVTDRAHIMMLKGELPAVAKDLEMIEGKKCNIEGQMNPLLLHDLGKGLLAKGNKSKAIRALRLALAACDGDWCRPRITQDLQNATQ